MALSTPRITVLLPARNAANTIQAAIRSILAQTFSDLELWVLENGSTDDTAQLAARFTDSRLKVFQLRNTGFQGALEFGLAKAKSPWLARMDADDVSLPDRLEREMRVIDANPDLVLVGTASAILTPAGHIVERINPFPSRIVDKSAVGIGRPNESGRGRYLADPSVVFSRSHAVSVGGYDPEFTMGDVPLWLRMLTSAPGWEIAEPLYAYRVSPTSFSRTHREGIAVRQKYTPDLLQMYLDMFELKREALPASRCTSAGANYWRHMTVLELISGDIAASQQTLNEFCRLGGGGLMAMKLRLACSLNRHGIALLRRRYAARYRARSDLEATIRHLVSPENEQYSIAIGPD
jgi:glycosyltransferase involved in cell wall biosynthesis